MEVSKLKEYIYDNNLVETILEAIDCHHIKNHGTYITAGNYDGDNPASIVCYLNEYLSVVNYTRSLLTPGQTRGTDILDLVMWAKDINFFRAVQWMCSICGLDYYAEEEELPDSLQILQMITQMNKECTDEDDEMTALRPIDPKILEYYLPVGNILFEQSNISLATQKFFEIAYDPQSNHIVIPIRDSLGTLVGIKGRIFQDPVPEGHNKYVYLQPCAKGRVLYGLDKNIDNIIRQGVVYVGESEKFVQQLYDMGYYGVATGGSKVSKHQVQMLTRLGVKIIICFDKDIEEDELKNIASQFVEGVPVYAILDRDNILNEKESPSDDVSKWLHLVQNNIYKITKEREEVDRDVN